MASQKPRESEDDQFAFLKERDGPATSSRTSLASAKKREVHDDLLAHGALVLALCGAVLPFAGSFCFPLSIAVLVFVPFSKCKLSRGGIVAVILASLINLYCLVHVLILVWVLAR